MIKKMIIIITLLFGLIGNNNVFASNVPYINNDVVKFNNISGLVAYSTPVQPQLIYNGFLYFTTNGDLIKQNITTGENTVVSTALYPSDIGVNDSYIFFASGNDGFMYRMNLDGSNVTQMNSVLTQRIFIIGSYVYYFGYNGNGFDIYRMNLDGSNVIQINNINSSGFISTFVLNNTYIYYYDNNIGAIYRMNLDGSNVIQIYLGWGDELNILGNYVFFIGDGGLNRINNDGTGFIQIKTIGLYSLINDGTFLYYSNANDGRKLYKIDVDGINNIKITDRDISSPISDGVNYIYYRDGAGQSPLYKVNVNNPEGYLMNDNVYKSIEVLNSNNLLYINTDTTLPSGTNYEFWLANQNTQEIILADGLDTDLSGHGRLDVGGVNMTTLGLNVGDEIILFKGGSEETTIITSILSNRIRFNNTVLPMDIGYGIKKASANFQKLNNSVLDGNTEINTQTVFGTVTDKLYYKLVLISNDNTKTPVINSVSITATSQTVVPPTNNGGSNTITTGGVNLSLGDGASISIPVEKQTTDFIKTLATNTSINPASLNTYSNVETFLKDNNYDYTNQLLIGSGSIPSQTMYNVVNLGLTNTLLADTLSGAINNPNYAKLILTQDTYLAGKRIINYLKMDKADDNGNLIISVYNSDTKEYIFLRKKD